MVTRADTEVRAANIALAILSEPSIAALSEANNRARACNEHFGSARDLTFRLGDWNFASSWYQPAADATKSPGPLKIRYPLPLEVAAVREIFDSLGVRLQQDEWAVEASRVTVGGAEAEMVVVVTNSTAPVIRGTRIVENVRLWDSLFVKAMGRALAMFICGRFGQGARHDEFEASHRRACAIAKTFDAREKARSVVSKTPTWIQARS